MILTKEQNKLFIYHAINNKFVSNHGPMRQIDIYLLLLPARRADSAHALHLYHCYPRVQDL